MSRFLVPTSRRLTLSGDDWIEVKDELSVGDVRKAGGWIMGMEASGERRGRMAPNFAQVMSYLLDWNLSGEDGKAVDIDTDARREAALDQPRKLAYDEIELAITKHIDVVAKEHAAAKKKTGTATTRRS